MAEENQKKQEEESPFGHIRHPGKRAFLETYATGVTIKAAFEAIDYRRSALGYWRAKDPEFVEAFEVAQQMSVMELVDTSIERAKRGLYRLKFDKNGEALLDPETGEVYKEYHPSDVLAIYLMKTILGGKFNDRVQHTGPDGGPIQHETRVEVAYETEWFPMPCANGEPADARGEAKTGIGTLSADQDAYLRSSMGKNGSGPNSSSPGTR